MPSDPRALAVDRVLRDGGSIHVRAIRPDDKQRLVDHFGRLSTRSVYYRFFGAKKELNENELRQFTELDFQRRVGLVATLWRDGEEQIIGVGRYAQLNVAPGEPSRAEVAFAVADDHQGRGIGSVLLEHLAEIARPSGIEEFEADVLGENNRMLAVFAKSGYRVERTIDAGIFHVSFPTAETEESLGAQQRRERAAAAASVAVFLQPRSVAVIGASPDDGSIGAALIRNLHGCGFHGPVYPVHPTAAEIAGLRVYPALTAIGQSVDLAIIALPAAQVEAAVAECARAGVRGVVVISAGFAEVSEAGRAVQQRLVALVRSSGMRMVGPNCMGVLNTDPAVSLNATFAPDWPADGSIAVLSQSGALGLAVLDRFARCGIGLANFVSVGNRADVSSNDVLAYWADDPRTAVIALYLESFGNPGKFARVAPEVARRKPIVAVKAAPSRAASSHSAALASRDVMLDGLFEQAGIIRTDTLAELIDVSGLLAAQPVPLGGRVGVVTNAGGLGVLFADAAEANGVAVAEFGEATHTALRELLPADAGAANPVVLVAPVSPAQYERALGIVGRDPNVDSVVVIYIATHPRRSGGDAAPPSTGGPSEDIAAAIARGAGSVPIEKPVLVVFMARGAATDALARGPRRRVPVYDLPEDAARALAAAARYGRWRGRPTGTVLELDSFAERVIRAVVERVLAGADGPRWVSPQDAATVLRAAGIEVAVSEEVPPADAVNAAERLGYPLAAKAVAPGLVHRSDRGGVQLDLHSAKAVETAISKLRAGVPELTAVLLQRRVDPGIEAVVSVTSDPTFGPLVACGLGGAMVALLRDVSYRLPPVTDVDAEEMIDRLRLAPLLAGYRGAPAGDRAALVELVRRVSALVDIMPELRQLDLNPVIVQTPGAGAIVVDAKMRLTRS